MSSPIRVFLHYNGGPGQEVTVDATDTVKSLEAFLPDTLPHRLYLGVFEICPAFTLGFVGVKDGDHVFATSRPEEKRKPLKPARKIKEPNEAEARRKMVNDRLHDQFFNHIEGTSISYRRVLSCFFKGKKQAEKKKEKAGRHGERTTIPETADQPFTEAMPRLWS